MQRPGRFARLGVGTLTVAVLWTSGCAPSVSETSAGTIVVGGKNFTEQLLVAEMTRLVLAANGFTVDLRGGMGSGMCVRIPVHRERPFRSNVNTDSDRW